MSFRKTALLSLVCLLPVSFSDASPQTRERIAFNDGWRFKRHDPAEAGDRLAYDALKPWIMATGTDLIGAGKPKPQMPEGNPGAGVWYVRPNFDDSDWRQLDLPHDWGIEGPFDQNLPGETGKLPWVGAGWYRKHFEIPDSDRDRDVFLDIDGAMSFSAIWVNGNFVGGWPYGYTSYRIKLTDHLNYGGDNVVVIRLHNPPFSSRWYPGSGIYRNVWLVKTSKTRIAHWGTFVSTPSVSADEAIVQVDVTVENETREKVSLIVRSSVHEINPKGEIGAEPVADSEPQEVEIDPDRNRVAARASVMRITSPRLWSLDSPNRYVVITTVERDGDLIDEVSTPFGIRSFHFDADEGFSLNGEKVMLQGVCMHHDLGALGTAINIRAIERQIEILQEMGCNAIRTSHNPPAPEFLELCDRMGMIVMVEAFDCWHKGKKWPYSLQENDPNIYYRDYARVFDDWYERDLRAMIRRDRNHPSVFMWSIGNEVIEQWFTDGWKLAVTLAGIVREEDRTRPITGGFNNANAGYIGFERAVDLIGFNYKPDEYARFHERRPTVPLFGSETASTISSRGEFFFPVDLEDKKHGRSDFHVSDYGYSAADWAWAPDVEFKGIDENPSVFGEFVWTGFDYLGEPTPFNDDATNLLNFADPVERDRMKKELEELGRIRVPSRSSYFGIIDLAGFPKDRYYIYQARWRPDLPMAHILPHWNWPEREGEVTPVYVFSSGDEAELFLNGESLGRKKRGPLEYRFRWDDVVYQPGELKVVAYKNGEPWAEDTRATTGEPHHLMLDVDRAAIAADGDDLAFITVKITDEKDRLVPRVDNTISYTIEGPGRIVAVDNGDPTSHESFQATTRRAFNGLALVVVRSNAREQGKITVTARSEGLRGASIGVLSE